MRVMTPGEEWTWVSNKRLGAKSHMLHMAHSEACEQTVRVQLLGSCVFLGKSLNLSGLVSTTLTGREGVIYSFGRYMNSNYMPRAILGVGKQWNPYL